MASNRNRITRWNHRVVRLRRVVGLVGEESPSVRSSTHGPFHSLLLAGIALLFFVAAPMTAAAVVCARDLRYAAELVFVRPAFCGLDCNRAGVPHGVFRFHPTSFAWAMICDLLERWPARLAIDRKPAGQSQARS